MRPASQIPRIALGKPVTTQMKTDFLGFFKEIPLCDSIEESLKSFDRPKKRRRNFNADDL